MGRLDCESPAVGTSSAHLFFYYRNLSLGSKFRSLIFTVPRTEIAVYTAMQLFSFACGSVLDASVLNSRLLLSSGWLVGIENSLANFMDQVRICFFDHGSAFSTAWCVFAWRIMRAIDWGEVLFVATSR